MKKAFVSVLLLLVFIAPAVSGELVIPASTTPITSFHEIWNIPWEVEFEEFAELAKRNCGILFEINQEGSTSTSYRPIPDQNVTVYSYPVEITAHFSSNTRLLSRTRFQFLDPRVETDVNYAYAMFASLFKDLANQYGSPSFAYFFNYYSDYREIPISLPNNNETLELVELYKLLTEPEAFPVMHVFFENIHLSCIGSSIRNSSLYVGIRIEAFSPAEKDDPYNIPEMNIIPYDQIDSIINTPIPETPTPVPQINIGL